MLSKKIVLNGIHDTKQFNWLASQMPCDVNLRSGKYCVDAKSILGIFSLELSLPVTLELESDDSTLLERFTSYFAS